MISIVFPGQGSQFVGMSKDFYNQFKISKDIFELIEDVTKINIKDIIFNNNDDLLNQTQFTQLAIFCCSISIYKTLISEKNINNEISVMLGHSLGEYTAMAASDIISIEDCAMLLKKRGELMQNAYPVNRSGMAAIIGLNCNNVEKIINQNNLNLEIANDNSPQQVVISGIKEELLSSKFLFKVNGAKRYVILNVSSAFHSKLMKDAELKLNEYIDKVIFRKSSISLISNFNAELTNNNDFLINNIKNQMSNRVRWTESIKRLEKNNIKKIIEIGPGKVLSGLIKRISTNFEIFNVETVDDIEKL